MRIKYDHDQRDRLSPPLATPENPSGIEVTLTVKGVNMVVAPGLHPRTWDQYISRANRIKDFPEEEKTEAVEIYRFFKKEFGDGLLTKWLKERHPFTYAFFVDGNRNRRWLAAIGKNIRTVSSQEKFPRLKKRLANTSHAVEAMDVLDIAARFVRAGFAVKFDPDFSIKNHNKEPDLLLRFPPTREQVVVEVTSMSGSADMRASLRSFNAVSAAISSLRRQGSGYALRLYQSLEVTQLKVVTTQITNAVRTHDRTGRFISHSIPGMIDFAMASKADIERLQSWCSNHDLQQGSVVGPPGEDRIERAVSRLRKKTDKQLPENIPGIVVVEHETSFAERGGIEGMIEVFEPVVAEYPHLVFAVIAGGLWTQDEDLVKQHGRHWFVYRAGQGWFSKKYLIVDNPSRKVTLLDETKGRLLQAFLS